MHAYKNDTQVYYSKCTKYIGIFWLTSAVTRPPDEFDVFSLAIGGFLMISEALTKASLLPIFVSAAMAKVEWLSFGSENVEKVLTSSSYCSPR